MIFAGGFLAPGIPAPRCMRSMRYPCGTGEEHMQEQGLRSNILYRLINLQDPASAVSWAKEVCVNPK